MIIKELNLISFGKFQNKIISFNDEINILYGENESGKSTVMAFIQFMFYGSTTKKSSISENIKLKYMPWDSEIIEGELTYTENGMKDCSGCLRPHKRENYESIQKQMWQIMELAKKL